MQVLKLGTRRSLLARAQSSWVAREIERANPGLHVELVGIDTRGDKILDVPLTQAQGKEFFVAELDNALLGGEVDLTVHSMKDLSLDRPDGVVLAAVPARANSRDVVLFGPSAIAALREGRPLRVGTSSPRRRENLPGFLARALPRLSEQEPRTEFMEIRGNVNTRLARVHERVGAEKHLDAVVLAFAGLIRLWADADARAELSRLLVGVRWMVMPATECPAAPAQGALAVECRAGDARTREALGKIASARAAEQAGLERAVLRELGGGCHQRFGASAVWIEGLGDLLFIRGARPDGSPIDELRWRAPARPVGIVVPWDGVAERSTGDDERLPLSSWPQDAPVFVAHSRAVDYLKPEHLNSVRSSRVWTSGTASWFRLARQGVWVEGCAENLGYAFLLPTLSEPVLNLPARDRWVVLTHDRALESWSPERALATYQKVGNIVAEPTGATHCFWGSGSQWDTLNHWVDKTAHHACGPGKTADHLRRAGVDPAVFPTVGEWRKWVGLIS